MIVALLSSLTNNVPEAGLKVFGKWDVAIASRRKRRERTKRLLLLEGGVLLAHYAEPSSVDHFLVMLLLWMTEKR